jgi:mono/diheme cytochrome c family protein
MRRACFALALLAACGPRAASPSAAPRVSSADLRWDRVVVQLPVSAAVFPAGEGSTIANSQCLACHSAGMVLNQPPQSEAQWTAIINKMRTAYGAPLPASQVDPLAMYLAKLVGPSGREQAAMSGKEEPRLPDRTASPDGAAIFETRCAPCHQSEGTGIPGVFPPLAGSNWVTGRDAVTVQILLHGVEDKLTVNDVVYRGAMPSFGSELNDREIAAVLTYVRGHWSNGAGPIDAARVSSLRASSASHAGPWKGDQDLEQLR